MKRITDYNYILWDFDGVIMDSMPIRDKGFEIVLNNFPTEQVDLLLEYHKKNGGLSRYHKFRYFYEEIRKESVTEDKINVLSDEFSKIMLNNLLDSSLLINDSIQFIQKYHSKFKMHIVSGSDEKELKYICNTLNISHYFLSINGSPTQKKQLVANLLKQNNLNKSLTCLIGDSKNDYEAAKINGIDFFGYNSSTLKKLGVGYINSFKNKL
jgi:phosphoglycolate phosphatase-like HAD superfamily hydrolase